MGSRFRPSRGRDFAEPAGEPPLVKHVGHASDGWFAGRGPGDRPGGRSTVSDSPISQPVTLGFLTVLQDTGGHVGGYLVTNAWGRPIEFRLTSAVQPTRVQSILYGGTLADYLFGELIGKTLVEKTVARPTLVVTDRPLCLALRHHLDVPVIAVVGTDRPDGVIELSNARSSAPLVWPAKFAGDRERIESQLAALDESVDLAEPFARIREAVAEARKPGASRAA